MDNQRAFSILLVLSFGFLGLLRNHYSTKDYNDHQNQDNNVQEITKSCLRRQPSVADLKLKIC